MKIWKNITLSQASPWRTHGLVFLFSSRWSISLNHTSRVSLESEQGAHWTHCELMVWLIPVQVYLFLSPSFSCTFLAWIVCITVHIILAKGRSFMCFRMHLVYTWNVPSRGQNVKTKISRCLFQKVETPSWSLHPERNCLFCFVVQKRINRRRSGNEILKVCGSIMEERMHNNGHITSLGLQQLLWGSSASQGKQRLWAFHIKASWQHADIWPKNTWNRDILPGRSSIYLFGVTASSLPSHTFGNLTERDLQTGEPGSLIWQLRSRTLWGICGFG